MDARIIIDQAAINLFVAAISGGASFCSYELKGKITECTNLPDLVGKNAHIVLGETAPTYCRTTQDLKKPRRDYYFVSAARAKELDLIRFVYGANTKAKFRIEIPVSELKDSPDVFLPGPIIVKHAPK